MELSRENVEESEKIICEYLCSPTHFSAIRRSSLKEGIIANNIKDKITGNILDAKHIGNSYDSIGDILIETENGPRYCELKMSKNTGDGTEFNITMETFTDTGVFKNNVLSWEEYMEKVNHEDTVMNLLQSYQYYPNSIHEEYNTHLQKKQELGRYIRDYIKENAESVENALDHSDHSVQQAAKIKDGITSFDRKIKKEYLTYLSNQEINQKRLKALVLVLAGGYHTNELVEEYIEVVEEVSKEVGGVGHVFDDYRVFYAYNVYDGKDEIKVVKGNQEDAIHHLSNKNNWQFKFKEDDENTETTNFKVGFMEDDTFQPVYQVALNWKNVFQGIYSPYINGFKTKYFKNI